MILLPFLLLAATAHGNPSQTVPVKALEARHSATRASAEARGGSAPRRPAGKVRAPARPAPRVSAVLEVSRARVTVGQQVALVLTVTNQGGLPILAGLSGPPEAAVADRASVCLPASATAMEILEAGAARSWTWTCTLTGRGPVAWSVTAMGIDVFPGSTAVAFPAGSGSVEVQSPPALAVTLAASRDRACDGRPFSLALTVENSGEATATAMEFGVPLAVPLADTAVSVSVLAEPEAVPLSLDGGGKARLGWTVAVTGPGTVRFTVSAGGEDANNGVAAGAAATTDPVRIMVPGRLEAAVFAREEASVGQWVGVEMSVTNTGETPVTGIAPAMVTVSGTGSFIRRFPGAEAFELEPGASRIVAWTYSVAGRGEIRFSGAVAGTTCECIGASAGGQSVMAAVNPAALDADIRVSSTEAIIGQWIRVVLTVTNTGEAAARGLRAEPLETGPAVLRMFGPDPRIVRSLPGGASTRFQWSYSVGGEAVIHFAGGARSRDANSGYPAVAPLLASPKVDLLTPALLRLESLNLMPNPTMEPGAIVTAILVVSNLGGASAQVTEVTVSETNTKGTALVKRSLASLGLPKWVRGGGVLPLIWTYRSGDKGFATVTAAVTAKEVATGRKFKSASIRSNQVGVRGTTTGSQ